MSRVGLQVRLDPLELEVGEVVALDRLLDLRVQRVNLVEDVVRLRLLRLDLSWVGGGRAGCEEYCRSQDEECRRLSSLIEDILLPVRRRAPLPGDRLPSQAAHPSKPI
jgi:hypothetical protein